MLDSFSQVISAAQSKSEEFERTLSHQHKPMESDGKGHLALALLSLLGREESEASWMERELRRIWNESRT